MSAPNPNVPAQFIAAVSPVREVILEAEADWAYWQAWLDGAPVYAYNRQGRAVLTLSATELRYWGKLSRELTLGLAVSERPAADTPDAVFLLQAFNSSRMFAWVERTFFGTPYDPARITVVDQPAAQIELAGPAGPLLRGRLAARAPASSGPELWQGRIYLPPARAGRYFVARLGGFTEVFPFAPETDTLALTPAAGGPALAGLRESGLTPVTWRVRHAAAHARSATLTRP